MDGADETLELLVLHNIRDRLCMTEDLPSILAKWTNTKRLVPLNGGFRDDQGRYIEEAVQCSSLCFHYNTIQSNEFEQYWKQQ